MGDFATEAGGVALGVVGVAGKTGDITMKHVLDTSGANPKDIGTVAPDVLEEQQFFVGAGDELIIFIDVVEGAVGVGGVVFEPGFPRDDSLFGLIGQNDLMLFTILDNGCDRFRKLKAICINYCRS